MVKNRGKTTVYYLQNMNFNRLNKLLRDKNNLLTYNIVFYRFLITQYRIKKAALNRAALNDEGCILSFLVNLHLVRIRNFYTYRV
jgi:hypothetical protein